MEISLYPLRFKPIYKEVIWGGEKLREEFGKTDAPPMTGESWEISGVQGNISVVENGYLKGNNLQEITEIYMGELVGDQVYEKFGVEFPILIKYIDANDLLSIQVHPDDELARERHKAYGKTEMWYIIDSEPEAKLISGFAEPISKEIYLENFKNKTLPEILNYEEVSPGDVFFMPAGRVHAIGSGILLAEIQQTSDITYRIYDWDRLDANGKGRELHTELAIDAIEYADPERYRVDYANQLNSSQNLVDSDFFSTGLIHLDQPVEKDFNFIDSFVIYMCVQGSASILSQGEKTPITTGETVLIPASLKTIELLPDTETKLLEIFLK
jgi:mannose-6-phosphate isomerase